MLALGGRYTELTDHQSLQQPTIARLSEQATLPMPLRKKQGFIIRKSQTDIPTGFGFYVAIDTGSTESQNLIPAAPVIALPEPYSYLADGDMSSGSILTIKDCVCFTDVTLCRITFLLQSDAIIIA